MAPSILITQTERSHRKRYFTWMIENATKFSRRLYSSTFSTDDDCKHKFNIVAKSNEMFPDYHISNISIGLQRADSEIKPIHVVIKVKLLNMDGNQYCQKESRWVTWKRDSAPIYVLSELFSDLPEKLTIPDVKPSISSEDELEMIGLKGKRLVGSYRNLKKVFVLPTNVLIVTGKIKIFGCCPVKSALEEPQRRKMVRQLPTNQILNDFRDAYINATDTDIQLIVSDQVLEVHKFVLQTRSPVFRSMFEHNTTEKNERAICISDVDFQILKALIWYLYTGEVQKLSYEEYCDLYEVADKYQVLMLQRACSELLMLSIRVDNACRIMVLADLHNDSILKDHTLHFIWRNFTKVKLTEEWEITVQEHPVISSEVLHRIHMFPCGAIPLKQQ